MTTWNMTTSTRPLDISLAHFRAWTCGDFDTAMTYIAPGIVCRTPAGEITGAQAYAEFMGPFAGGLHRAELLASFGDDHRAMIIYDTVTAASTMLREPSCTPSATA